VCPQSPPSMTSSYAEPPTDSWMSEAVRSLGSRASGGTGRRPGFRYPCLRTWGFESPLAHFVLTSAMGTREPRHRVIAPAAISDTTSGSRSPNRASQRLTPATDRASVVDDRGCRNIMVDCTTATACCWSHSNHVRRQALSPQPARRSPVATTFNSREVAGVDLSDQMRCPCTSPCDLGAVSLVR
jgi:hypothetical protein